MSSFGNNDNAANAPLWAAQSVNLAPTSASRTTLYGNTTANVIIAGETVGLFAVDTAEAMVDGHVHPGWVLRTTGSGGRAGRVQEEVLAVVSQFNSDNNGADDSVYADAIITITQPSAFATVNAASANTVTFSVVGTTVVPSNAVLTYKWQVNNNTGGDWVDIDNGTNITTGQPGGMIKSNANTATLTLDPTDKSANNYVYRAVITATNTGISGSSKVAYSANSQLEIT
jgi:hypothetical protein